MKVLVLGASSPDSVGYTVGSYLQTRSHEIVYASRTGALGRQCDVRNHTNILRVVGDVQPEVIIYAAGIHVPPQPLGEFSAQGQDLIATLLAIKSCGVTFALNAAVAVGCVKYFIVLGGRENSTEPGYAFFTVGNGALFSAVRFANAHTRIRSHFVDMPLVEGSTMAEKFIADSKEPDKLRALGALPANMVSQTVEELITPPHNHGERVILGENWSI